MLVEKPAKEMIHFSIDFNVDREVVYLHHNEEVSGTVVPDSHGQFFVIDLREREYDTDINMLVTKTDMPEYPLTVEMSLTVGLILLSLSSSSSSSSLAYYRLST